MSARRPRRLRAFAHHLVLASGSFAFIAVMLAGFALLMRWALALESASSSTQRALAATREILLLHEAFWISAAVSVVAACISGAWLARHITGPLRRFVRSFDEIGAGRAPAPLSIRATDYLGDELAAFNAMAGALAARERERGAAAAELLGELEELEAAARERRDEIALGALDRARDLVKRLAAQETGRARD